MKWLARIIVIAMIWVAVFADFVAGERPILSSIDGDVQVFAQTPEPLAKGDWALWPPIRFDPRSVRSEGRLSVLASPSDEHILGTDDRGRDVTSRLVHGTRLSLLLAGACALLATVLGALLALLATARRELDAALVIACDVLAAIPVLLVVLVVRGLTGAESLVSLIVLISIPRAASTARITREALRGALRQPYCEAARAIGCSRRQLVIRHAFPQSFPQLRVAAALTASTAVIAEVALSFLGLGASGPSWGELLSQAHTNQLAYWLLLPSGIATALLAWSLTRAAD